MDVLSDILPTILGALSPSMPFSRMKPRITPSSFFAQTTKTSAIGEFVIHILLPVSRNPPSAFLACASMLPGSEP